jgi:hypothetical protein
MVVLPDEPNPATTVTFAPTTAAIPDDQRHSPTLLRRSEIGHQPNVREPIAHCTRSRSLDTSQITFLQLDKTRAHRSVMDRARYARMSKDKQIHVTTWNNTCHLEPWVDDTVHMIDPALITSLEDELKVWGYVMTQYNFKPGLRKFKARGEKAAINKLTQLHIMDTWNAMDASRLSREEQLKALSSLLFLKKNGAIKGRACINGNGAPQREYISKEEAASPTVSTELTFITAAIAANKKRKVRYYDVPSTFVNTDVSEDVLMVLKGELADIMVQIVPQVYRKNVTVDRKGTPILYVKLQKALYGLMRASLLFYRKLRKELEAYGFTINPYNPCIANITSRCGKQLTVVWHVDDLMALCEVDFELTRFSCYLAKIYRLKLTIHIGQNHNYLGVNMEFKDDGTLDVSMVGYLKNVILHFLEMISRKASTPAGYYLFQIREKGKKQKLWNKRGHLHSTTPLHNYFSWQPQSKERHIDCGSIPHHPSKKPG